MLMETQPQSPLNNNEPDQGRMPTEEMVLSVLRQVVDPEIGCNIVDLGLIYGLEIKDGRIAVTMTLTTPGCPMHESLVAGVEEVLRMLPGVQDVQVNVVWDPPWSPAMMTDYGRQCTGIG